jgi:monoamine oxidase
MPGRRQPLARAVREYAQIRLEAGDGRPVTLEEALARSTPRAEPGRISRRDLLRIGGTFGAAWALAACTSSGSKTRASSSAPLRTSTPSAHDARVAVIGAGLAGVTAAYRLAQAGVGVQLFESRDRVGGRCWTARGFADGQTAEHGGEFIDTRHVHIIGLAKELGLDLDDLWKGWVDGSLWPNWVGGKLLDHHQIQDQIHPIAAAVTEEAKRIGVIPAGGGEATDAAFSYGTATPAAVELDQMSMSEWLDANAPGVTASPLGTYLNEIMAGWYGLDMTQLSAVTWMDYFVIPVTGADERWHVKGGNDQIPNLAAGKLPAGTLQLEIPLTALIARSDGSYELRFEGMSSPVVADFVILALPFTTLRQVDLTDAGFGEQRMYAIDNQGMGADVKLLLQYDERPHAFTVAGRKWSGGMEHCDPNFETWESSTDQPGASGLITVYAGGANGSSWTADVAHGPAPAAFASEYVGHIDDVVPGTAGHYNGTAWLDLWTHDPWTNGAYAAFLPGQWTKFWKYTASPEGGVHFAGEHTSTYSQGYLNGGVESGQRAAIEVMRAIGVPVPESIASLPYSPIVA